MLQTNPAANGCGGGAWYAYRAAGLLTSPSYSSSSSYSQSLPGITIPGHTMGFYRGFWTVVISVCVCYVFALLNRECKFMM